MNPSQLSLVLILLCFLITFTAASNNPNHFTGDVSINCGSTGTSAASNRRQWLGDIQPQLSNSLLQLNGVSTTSTVIHKLTSADPVPHKTARLSRSLFSYAFQVNPGQKIIRLHFNPTPYRGFKGLKDLFTVEAGPFTLLTNFSASLTAHALAVNSLTKEFCLNIHENQQLTITFSPESSQSLDTYAFINGIEIISVPPTLSYFDDIGLQVVGHMSLVYVDNSTALEIIRRLNIKQDLVPSTGDFDDMFPKWATDRIRNNMTWKIPVEVGFRYLIRLHFSQLGLKIAGTGGLIFKVLINEMIAHTNSDILKARGENNNVVLYKDCVVMMRGLKKDGKRDLLISIESYDEVIDVQGVLEGFEIVKLSNPDNSLASPNPLPPPQDSPSPTIRVLFSVLGHRNGTATIAVTIISLLSIIVHKLREMWEATNSEEEHKPSARAERHCCRFSLAEIQSATKNFNDGLFIGRGGFGKVYKALIDKGKMTVAIKRLKSNSQQGAREFLMEVETLSELRHINLVSLIGYCRERREMILVYEYMPCGTLADHLYKHGRDSSNCSSLTWKQRLNICIGAGRGLDYLHTGHRIIHRDIKASNILLDENFVAKVSDFGLAKPEDRSKLQSHVSTKVKGTRGYLDAQYINTCKLTRKTDIYAFGVVLFEVLCGRPAVDFSLPEGEWLLSRWARDKINKGEVDHIVASILREEISPNSLKTFVEVAERCLDDEPKNRPTMSQVVLQLEFALEQQDNKQPLVLYASDEIEQSVSTGQPTTASRELQNLTNPPEDQSNSKVVNSELHSGKKFGRKGAVHKQSRLSTWWAILNRVYTSLSESNAGKNRANEIAIGAALRYVTPKRYKYSEIKKITNSFSDKLGQGGYGSVYKGMLPDGCPVAVKVLIETNRHGEDFINEVASISRTSHVNVVSLLGFCYERNKRALVYEYMPNQSLDKFLNNNGSADSCLDLGKLYEIAVGIARGLEYLHTGCNTRIVHFDIKPHNILLDDNFCPKISDFGLATLYKKKESISSLSGARGTIGYIAPEVLSRNFGGVSDKSDVYSYGMMVLEMAGARKIFETEEIQSSENYFPVNIYDQVIVDANKISDDFMIEEEEETRRKMFLIGYWCVQISPSDRPSMSKVVEMFQGSLQSIPIPPKPFFFPPNLSKQEISSSFSAHVETENSDIIV